MLLVTTESSRHPYPRKHRRPAFRRDQDQGFHRCQPFRRLVLGLRQLGDLGPGILERHELAAAGKRDRFVECSLPPAINH